MNDNQLLKRHIMLHYPWFVVVSAIEIAAANSTATATKQYQQQNARIDEVPAHFRKNTLSSKTFIVIAR